MSAKLFRFPAGVAPAEPAPPPHISDANGARFFAGNRVKLKVTDAPGTVVGLEMGLIQRGADLVLVWRYTVQFGRVRLGGFLVDELIPDDARERA